MPYKNQADQNACANRWYRKNRQKQIAASLATKASVVSLYRSIKASLQCVQCGEADADCLTFHHRDPSEKTFTIASMYSRSPGRRQLLREIDKCDCLCANCHMKLEASIRRGNVKAVAAVDKPLPLFDIQ